MIMKRRPTISTKKTAAVIAFILALMLFVSGLFSLQNNSSRMAAAAVVESVKEPAQTEDSAGISQIVENRMTEEAAKAADARTKTTSRALGAGEASYYGRQFAGRLTANGETFDPAALTAAHRTLPFGSKVRLTNTGNGRSVVVRINDRGPFVEHRLIDVSSGAADELGMIQSGTAHVKLELIS